MMMNGKIETLFAIEILIPISCFRSSTTSIGGRSQPLRNPTLNDVDYEILDVHENLKNRPVFG